MLSCLVLVQRNARPLQPSFSAFRSSPAIPLFSYKRGKNAFFAPASREVATIARSPATPLRNLFLGTSIGLLFAFGYYYITDTRASVHQWLVVPSLRWIYKDAEEAHEAGTNALKALYRFGLHPRERGSLDSSGKLEVEVSTDEGLAKQERKGITEEVLIGFWTYAGKSNRYQCWIGQGRRDSIPAVFAWACHRRGRRCHATPSSWQCQTSSISSPFPKSLDQSLWSQLRWGRYRCDTAAGASTGICIFHWLWDR